MTQSLPTFTSKRTHWTTIWLQSSGWPVQVSQYWWFLGIILQFASTTLYGNLSPHSLTQKFLTQFGAGIFRTQEQEKTSLCIEVEENMRAISLSPIWTDFVCPQISRSGQISYGIGIASIYVIISTERKAVSPFTCQFLELKINWFTILSDDIFFILM